MPNHRLFSGCACGKKGVGRHLYGTPLFIGPVSTKLSWGATRVSSNHPSPHPIKCASFSKASRAFYEAQLEQAGTQRILDAWPFGSFPYRTAHGAWSFGVCLYRFVPLGRNTQLHSISTDHPAASIGWNVTRWTRWTTWTYCRSRWKLKFSTDK